MKRILFMIAPLILLMLAFRPVGSSHSVTVTGTGKAGNTLDEASVREQGLGIIGTCPGSGAIKPAVQSNR